MTTYYLLLFVILLYLSFCFFFFFKQKTAYEMRISDWSSDVCSSDLKEIDGAAGKSCAWRGDAARSGGAVSVAAELHGSGGSGGGSGIAVRAGGAGSGGGVAAGGAGGAVLACDRCAAGERDARGCGGGWAWAGAGRGSEGRCVGKEGGST